ncbi:hypothetical protein GCM10009817_11500 [Terrabacter lapilli]|uniref:Uncharacterized protein n=1 Tax=Terrabacter lapilli TaxID=436231 RepID=A0ABP5D2F9_9MICO
MSASIIAGMERVNRSARAIEDAVPYAMGNTLGGPPSTVCGLLTGHTSRRVG